MPKRIVNGRRGGFLISAGVSFGMIGASWVVVPSPSREAAFNWLPAWFDRADLGMLFMVSAGVVIVLALLHKVLPSLVESISFAILVLPPALTAGIFLVSFVLGLHPVGWLNALTYIFYSLAVWVVAGWPNPPIDTPHGDTKAIFLHARELDDE